MAKSGNMICNNTNIILESLNLLYKGNLWIKKSFIPPGSLDARDRAKITTAIRDHFKASFKNKIAKKKRTKKKILFNEIWKEKVNGRKGKNDIQHNIVKHNMA